MKSEPRERDREREREWGYLYQLMSRNLLSKFGGKKEFHSVFFSNSFVALSFRFYIFNNRLVIAGVK